MNKYDVIYTERFEGYTYGNRYTERVEANNKEEAKEIIINKYKDKTLSCIKVKEAQDYICWTYKSERLNDNTFGFKITYYGGYLDLRPFGYGVMCEETKEKAKRFMTQEELKNELKKIGRKITDYKIERIEVK